MGIRRMIPMGRFMRKCIVCGYQITAISDQLTVHELKCLKIPYEGYAEQATEKGSSHE
jgi:hypothetical protein